MNKIWMIIIVISICIGLITGNQDKMLDSLLEVPKDSLEMLIKVGGLIIFYNGLFRIVIDAKIVSKLCRKKIVIRVTKYLFPTIPPDSKAMEYITSNIIVNFLGLGIASTSLALNSLKEMQEINKSKHVLTKEMITFIFINISAFTFLPITVLTYRNIYKATIDLELIPCIIIATLITNIFSIILSKISFR